MKLIDFLKFDPKTKTKIDSHPPDVPEQLYGQADETMPAAPIMEVDSSIVGTVGTIQTEASRQGVRDTLSS